MAKSKATTATKTGQPAGEVEAGAAAQTFPSTAGRYTRLRDIPKFTRSGGYQIDVDLKYLPKTIAEYQSESNLQLCPDFQRGHVWTRRQQIAFVEFFLRGGTTGRIVYLNDPSRRIDPGPNGYRDFVVVDGLQRLTALLDFAADKFAVFGSLYSEFADRDRTNCDLYLKININDLQTRAEVLRWYLEMNSGGTPHTNTELERVRGLLEAERAAGGVGA